MTVEKEIKVEFSAQSKAVVEKISIKYTGELPELESRSITNASILQETIELQLKAAEHSRQQTMLKMR